MLLKTINGTSTLPLVNISFVVKQHRQIFIRNIYSCMKYYESNFEEYISSVFKYNIHPELDHVITALPSELKDFQNMIIYGPPGVGKYSQALYILQRYSASKLKYDKKVGISNEKQDKKKPKTESKRKLKDVQKPLTISKTNDYLIRISDIHYEVDMSLLGCNSKTLWHDIFFQIVDIVSLKTEKTGIIVCKNFHCIYNELLDVFYNYMKHPIDNVQIKFILLTEHVGFITHNIYNSCFCIHVPRPEKHHYVKVFQDKATPLQNKYSNVFTNKNTPCVNEIDTNSIVNTKEIYQCKHVQKIDQLPGDIFNIITNNIITEMLNPDTSQLKALRNHIYDLLIYNLDIAETISYILYYCIENDLFDRKESISDTIKQTFTFLKYFNNNYRSIYHIESMIIFMMCKIHNYENT